MEKRVMNKIFLVVLIGIFFIPVFASADSLDQSKDFFVDKNYDLNDREKVSATLKKISDYAYFYVEKDWYSSLEVEKKREVLDKIEFLADEFDNNIYPVLTNTYGKEWSPGIDNDYHVTILYHEMDDDVAGYFRTNDEYSPVQAENSNEREMIYLNSDRILTSLAKVYISEELPHLISFNQKERLRGVEEDVWLNELRAEYAPTLLGYNDSYQGSILQRRLNYFISSPSDSLTEWQNQLADYGMISIFGHYLVDNYGIGILSNTLKMDEVGIPSLNKFLENEGYDKSFSDIFNDWTVAIFLNDCSAGEYFCYKDDNLENIRINPSLIFLPSTQKTNVSLNYSTKQWSGNWYRIIGGEGKLNLDFDGDNRTRFNLTYVLCDHNKPCEVNSLILDNGNKGNLVFDDFGGEWSSLTIIPAIESKKTGFDGREIPYDFSIDASMEVKAKQDQLIEELKAKIVELKAQIAELQRKLAEKLGSSRVCGKFFENLTVGSRGYEVECLQEFLKSQGDNIYPEGLVTGYFGNITRNAVIRFQDLYSSDILEPLGLKNGTGFFGSATREKVNKILNN